MQILAIDPGKTTGFAAITNGMIESGVVKFTVDRGESRGMLYIKFNRWLNEIFALVEPELVIYEQAHQRGGAATEILVGMVTRIQEKCVSGVETDYFKLHSATLKKFATGSGRASKEMMIEACIKKLHREPETDDEADALWLLEYARDKYDLEEAV